MLPKEIKLRGHTFLLKPKVPELLMGPGHWGLIDFGEGTISIVAGIPASRQIESILHEVLHGLLFGQNVKCEEALVTTLTEGFLMFLRDNPQLVKHIMGKL